MTPRDPTSLLPLTPATLEILLSVSKAPMHGYGIKRDVEARTDERVLLGAGTLYAGLQRMERDGLIEETAPPEGMTEEASTRWRFFRITAFGRAVRDAELVRLEEVLTSARTVVPSLGGR